MCGVYRTIFSEELFQCNHFSRSPGGPSAIFLPQGTELLRGPPEIFVPQGTKFSGGLLGIFVLNFSVDRLKFPGGPSGMFVSRGTKELHGTRAYIDNVSTCTIVHYSLSRY